MSAQNHLILRIAYLCLCCVVSPLTRALVRWLCSAYTTSGSAVGVVAGVTLVAVAVVAVSCRRSRTTDHAQFLENNPLVASESTPLLV